MSGPAGTPEPRLYFLSRSGADADVALAVAGLVQEAGHRTILQDQDFTHQDFMAAMERAFAAGDQGAVTVAFVSADYLASEECRAELSRASDGTGDRVIAVFIGALPADLDLPVARSVDLGAVLAIEDDENRSLGFVDTIRSALGLAVTPPQSGGDNDNHRLAQALAGDALALRLASRLFAERSDATVDAYLEAVAEHINAAHAGLSYPRERRAALLTSFEVVESDTSMQGQSATSLLALAAHAPEGRVPASAFHARPDAYPAELAPFADGDALRMQALALLERLSLVAWNGPGDAYASDPEILAIVRDLLAEAGRAEEWRAATVRLVAAGGETKPQAESESKRAGPSERSTAAGAAPAGGAPLAASDSAPLPEDRPAPPSRDSAFAAFEQGEAHAKDGEHAAALRAFETARAIFQDLADANPDDAQAEADLAACHAKLGLTYAQAGHAGEGVRWLKSCRKLIEGLSRREPANALWPRYLASLDGQLAELAAKSPPTAPPKHPAAQPPAPGGDTVRRLVNALKEPPAELLDPPAEALNAEEPPPLVLDESRTPPKVFSDTDDEPVVLETEAVAVRAKRRILPLAVNGHGHDGLNGHGPSSPDALGPAPDPLVPQRKAGFLKRLFGR